MFRDKLDDYESRIDAGRQVSTPTPVAKSQCKDGRHYFDVVDGKLALVCRCGNKRRSQMT